MTTELRAQGWCSDPFRRHDARWISDGACTALVRSQGVESFDEVPVGSPPFDAVPIVWGLAAADGVDLLRSDRTRASHHEGMSRAASRILTRSHG